MPTLLKWSVKLSDAVPSPASSDPGWGEGVSTVVRKVCKECSTSLYTLNLNSELMTSLSMIGEYYLPQSLLI